MLNVTSKHVPSDQISIWDGALSHGYGQISRPAFPAMKMIAQAEGLILGPVYTANTFAAIPALIENEEIAKGSKVIFVHTGGLASLFAYQADLERLLRAS